ncbi:MAG TPA: hypothetical protein VHC72_03215 [Bryobacteraceae bacterium]|nr:hypothetical protein [Bryobacteraceae bacterium]
MEPGVTRELHATDDQLELYALGRAPASDIPPLEQHLLICTACQERLDNLAAFADGMRDALADYSPEVRPRLSAAEWLRRADIPARIAFWLPPRTSPWVSMTLGCAALVIIGGIVAHDKTGTAEAATLQLTAVRGEMPITVPAREFDLALTDSPREGGPYRVQILNVTGALVWQRVMESAPAGLRVRLKRRLPPGDYFVRLYSPADVMLREYGFRVHANGRELKTRDGSGAPQ